MPRSEHTDVRRCRSAYDEARPRRGLEGVSSSALTGILSLLAGLLLLPLIISRIGSAQYGLWLVIAALVNYMQYSDVGIGSAIVHFGSRARGGANERMLSDYVSAGLVWNLSAALVTVPVFAVASSWYLGAGISRAGMDPGDGAGLVVVGSLMLGCVLIAPFSSALVGAGLMPIERRNQSIGVVVRVVGTLTACLLTADVVWVALAEMLGVVLPQLLSLVGLLRRRLLRLRWDSDTIDTLRLMLSFSLKSFGVAAVGALILQAGTVIVGIFLGPSDVTYFNAAYRVYSSVRQVLTWTVDPFRSALSRLFAKDGDAARRILTALTFSSVSVACIGVGTLALSSVQVVELWLGRGAPTGEVSATMVILLLGFVVNSTQIPFVPAGDAIGRPGAFFRIQVVWLIGFLVIACALVQRLGIVGVALGLSIPLAVVSPLYVVRAHRVLDLRPREWAFQGVFPTMWFVLPGMVVAAVAVFVQWRLGSEPFSLLTGTLFACSTACAAVLMRRRLPMTSLNELLRVEL